MVWDGIDDVINGLTYHNYDGHLNGFDLCTRDYTTRTGPSASPIDSTAIYNMGKNRVML